MTEFSVVRPLGLKDTAAAIARNYNSKGAVIITLGDDETVRIGVSSLTQAELREILCVAIHYSFADKD